MSIVVQKFGGSSVGSPEKMKRVARRVMETRQQGHDVAVVVSAMGDTTDDLIALAAQLSDEPSEREMDMLLSTGEQISISLLAMTLTSMGCPAVSLTGRQAGFRTDVAYSKAKILNIDNQRVMEEFAKGNVVVVAGFQGVDDRGEVHTLGRGGSDTSAVALAIALDADMCEIYTDVNGVYTADPRVVKKAQKMDEVSYDEMLEMAVMGAVVLQPRSVELAKEYDLKLHVRSSYNYTEGTIVKEDAKMNKDLEKEMIVVGVAHDLNVLKASIFGVPDRPGVASELFATLAEEGVNVDMIIQSGSPDQRQDISFTCARNDKVKCQKVLSAFVRSLPADSYSLVDTMAKISAVGAGMITHTGVAATMFRTLSDNGINIDMIATSEIRISCIIDERDVNKAAVALHTAFGLDAE
ncbi:MAG: aspartate kinase [Firmicutes bacterium]|nr:aspartate kinase [Bacillota bacterium]